MKTIIKLPIFVLAIGLFAGCATTSDIEKLQLQVNDLSASVGQASAEAARAHSAAADAAAKAESAEAAANRAANKSRTVNRKLNKKAKTLSESSSDKKIKSSMIK